MYLGTLSVVTIDYRYDIFSVVYCVPEVLRHALQRPDDPRQQQVGVEAAQGELDGVLGINTVIKTSAVKRSIGSTNGSTITEKAPTRAFSYLKAATTAFTFKTLLRHYAKQPLTPRSLNVKLGPRRIRDGRL